MKTNQGFTLIELLVVISILGILSSITLVSLSSTRAKARDSRRVQDLHQIRNALILHENKFGNFIESKSGCGWGNGGYGWFNYEQGGKYEKSIAQCLVDTGITTSIIIDPSGLKMSTPKRGNTYMKYHCGPPANRRVYIYAKLETLPQDPTATDNTCCSTCDSRYGMNYYLRVQ